MAALGNFTMNDGQTTPVAHTFEPVSHSLTEFVYRDNATGLTVLSAPMCVLAVLPSKDKSIERYREKIILPALETLTSSAASGYQAAPKLAYSLSKISDYVIPSRATLAQRKDLVAFGAALPNITQFQNVYYYGTRPY